MTTPGSGGAAPEAVELVRASMALRQAHRAAHGEVTHRPVVLVRAVAADGAEGWGECPALARPTYESEFVGGVEHVLAEVLVPAALEGRDAGVVGHGAARYGLATALLDLELRRSGRSLAAHLGATRSRVEASATVGLGPPGAVEEAAAAAAAAGYRNLKVKVAPGSADAVKAAAGAAPGLTLTLDANGSFAGRPADLDPVVAAAGGAAVLLEQPLAADDLVGHAALRARLGVLVALDEGAPSVGILEAAAALGAADVACLKPHRFGTVEAAAAAAGAARTAGLSVRVGGMLETGVGRAALLALAAIDAADRPGDVAASDRYWDVDLTEPAVLEPDGTLAVPAGPGLGVAPDAARLAAVVAGRRLVRRGDEP